MEYQLKYVAKEYEHGWTVWIQRDTRKTMIGSAVKTEAEVNELVSGIKLEKEKMAVKPVSPSYEELLERVVELEKYKTTLTVLNEMVKKWS